MEESSANMEESSANMEESSANMIESSANMEESSASMDEAPANIDKSLTNMEELSVNRDKDTHTPVEDIKHCMLNYLASTDAHFKHQQRGEPDLEHGEKYQVAKEILKKNTATFLERFGKYIREQDLSYFEQFRDKYLVNHYVNEIRKRLDSAKCKHVVRNRRFEAMKRLMMDTDYFGDEEMKSRDPLLYHQLIGQYLDSEEIQSKADTFKSMSGFFLQQLQSMKNNALYDHLKDFEESQMEESDDDEEEEEKEEEGDFTTNEKKMSSYEIQMLRTEFLRTMQTRFMNGEDDYEYSSIDNNAEYDSIEIQSQDAEEQYFDKDDEECENIASMESDSQDEDYKTFVVAEDVCPGLSQQSQTEHTEKQLLTNYQEKLSLAK